MSRIVLVIVLVLHAAVSAASDNDALMARKAAWRQHLERQKFRFEESLAGIAPAIARFSGDCQLHIVYDPARTRRGSFTIKLVRDGQEVLALKGHQATVFEVVDGTFLFARFGPTHPDCAIEAYSMTTGKKLWEASDLRDFGPFGASAYSNEVTIRGSRKDEVPHEEEGGAIVVTGREGYGDYIAVLDSKMGTILASKVYRKGFVYQHSNDEIKRAEEESNPR